ncbi:MAG TPA: alpha-galactosidase, partial [Bacteroidota bacterium]|nr:alpha-galactosidase [Bacteroidota bacterium]
MLLAAIHLFALPLAAPAGNRLVNQGGKIVVEFDGTMKSRVIAHEGGEKVLGDFSVSEYLVSGGKEISDFAVTAFRSGPYHDSLGSGTVFEISGSAGPLEKKASIVAYADFPTMLFYNVEYRNRGSADIAIEEWGNNRYSVHGGSSHPALWSYQPGSY